MAPVPVSVPTPPPRAPTPVSVPTPPPMAPTPVSVPAPPSVTQAQVSVPTPPPVVPSVVPAPAPSKERVVGGGVSNVEGNVGNANNVGTCSNVDNVNEAVNGRNVDDNDNVDDVGERVESFWTACPYCLYLYEYEKVYLDCTLRCQNCRRAFHGLEVPNPPPIGPAKVGRGDKDKQSMYSCWAYYPLGFSMVAWKKHKKLKGPDASTNWAPFAPKFPRPGENIAATFQQFGNNGETPVAPMNVGRESGVGNASPPWVYVDDDEDLLEFSDSTDSDSSDNDWRQPGTYQIKRRKTRKKKRKMTPKKERTTERITRGRARKVDNLNRVNQNSVGGGGVSVGGEDLEDESTDQVVVGSVADQRAASNVVFPVMRKHTRRSVKDLGRLDLNVEFNEVDEHAPAENGGEDGIGNIEFFEGLDEFLSTLPMLNVGDEKSRPS